jgi:hypothetical protein
MIGAMAAVSRFRSILSPETPLSTLERLEVSSFIDRLIPSDSFGPGAIELGIAEVLAGRITDNPDYLRLVRRALIWLDGEAIAQGAERFSALHDDRKDLLISRIEQMRDGHDVNRAFRRLLDDTLALYYTKPEAWPAIGYQGPPQPLGYLDHAKPPTPPGRS